MFNLIASLCVHEDLPLINNWFENYNHFNPNSFVIIHLSKDAPISFQKEILNLPYKNFILNPEQVSNKNNFVLADLSNFKLSQKFQYKYFHLSFINTFFVKHGFQNFIEKNTIGVVNFEKVHIHSGQYQELINKGFFQKLENKLKIRKENVYKSRNEGFTVSIESATLLFKTIEEYFQNDLDSSFCEHEFFYSTLLNYHSALPAQAIKIVDIFEELQTSKSKIEFLNERHEDSIFCFRKVDETCISYFKDLKQ